MDKLTVCQSTRDLAARAAYKALDKLLKDDDVISELGFREAWLNELRKSKELFPDGWYMPPPHGMGVLFATDLNSERIKFDSLRNKKYWPRKDVYLDREKGLVVLYVSPVDKKSFIIGDFGLTLYFGDQKDMKKSFKKYLGLINDVFDHARLGMSFSELNLYSQKIFEKGGFSNHWVMSKTDPTGTNYGHTAPSTDIDWTQTERAKLRGKNSWEQKTKIISNKRKFLNETEDTFVKPGIVFTLEPRLVDKRNVDSPDIYFHTIIAFDKKGKKKLLTGFDRLFKLAGMDYML